MRYKTNPLLALRANLEPEWVQLWDSKPIWPIPYWPYGLSF